MRSIDRSVKIHLDEIAFPDDVTLDSHEPTCLHVCHCPLYTPIMTLSIGDQNCTLVTLVTGLKAGLDR